MAKRFADTGILNKKWYRLLSQKMKNVWWHLTLACDHAGVWDVDEFLLSAHIGEDVTLEEIKKAFGEKLHFFKNDEKIFIRSFVEFQYGELSETNKAHKSVIAILKKYGLSERLEAVHRLETAQKEEIFKGHASPLEGAKDKDKDKDKDKEKEKKRRETPQEYDSIDFLDAETNAWLDSGNVSNSLRDEMLQTYRQDFLKNEIVKAKMWNDDAPKSKKKKAYGLFLKNWFENARDPTKFILSPNEKALLDLHEEFFGEQNAKLEKQ